MLCWLFTPAINKGMYAVRYEVAELIHGRSNLEE
jgi:hypothetical protein